MNEDLNNNDRIDYEKINKQFEHKKREYIKDFNFIETSNKIEKENIKKDIVERKMIKTAKPVNNFLKCLLFSFKVIFLLVLCFLIFSVSRYNYLQEKNGENVITFESFVENVKDSTVITK